MNKAAEEHGFTWEDPSAEVKTAILHELSAIAEGVGMTLTVCSQPELATGGLAESKCVDAHRIMDVAGKRFNAKKKGSRKQCGCFYSKDIGDYDTCPHGCVYCYAVKNRDLASRRYREHDPEGEFLFPRPGAPPRPAPTAPPRQGDLFGGKQ